MDTAREQRILKFSIGVTVAVSAVGFIGGLLVGSQAILFDGIYSLVDVALTLVSLSVLRLVAREHSPRFQYGYWHLEPMVEALGGVILSLACVYALANAVIGLTTGGHEVKFGPALWWAALLSASNLGMAAFVAQRARRLQSALLWLDVRGWLLGGLDEPGGGAGLRIGAGAAWWPVALLGALSGFDRTGVDQPGGVAGAGAQCVESHA